MVCRATMCTRVKTVQEWKSTTTPSNHHTGSAASNHLAEHYSRRLVNELPWKRSPEESINAPGDEMTRELRKQCYWYPDRWQQAYLEKERKAYQEESWQAHPAIGEDKCTARRVDVKCTYKCTNLEDDQCDWNSTGEMMRRSSEFGLCRTSPIMSTEAVLNDTENDHRTSRIDYRTSSRETATQRHHKTESPNTIMRNSWDNYGEMITEISQRPRSWPNDSRLELNKGNIGNPQPMAPTGMFTQQLTNMNAEWPYWRAISLLGRCWRSIDMITDGHHLGATSRKRWCHISRLADRAIHKGAGVCKWACIYIRYEWPFDEKLTR